MSPVKNPTELVLLPQEALPVSPALQDGYAHDLICPASWLRA